MRDPFLIMRIDRIQKKLFGNILRIDADTIKMRFQIW